MQLFRDAEFWFRNVLKNKIFLSFYHYVFFGKFNFFPFFCQNAIFSSQSCIWRWEEKIAFWWKIKYFICSIISLKVLFYLGTVFQCRHYIQLMPWKETLQLLLSLLLQYDLELCYFHTLLSIYLVSRFPENKKGTRR